jgi:hypothetical protein
MAKKFSRRKNLYFTGRSRLPEHPSCNDGKQAGFLDFADFLDLPIAKAESQNQSSRIEPWVGSCAITIKRQHNRTPWLQSRALAPPLRSRDQGSQRNTLYCPVVPTHRRFVDLATSYQLQVLRRSIFLTTRGAPPPVVSFIGGFRTPADQPTCVSRAQ